jgi:hypothetical protein
MKYKVIIIIRTIFSVIFFITASKEDFAQRITPSLLLLLISYLIISAHGTLHPRKPNPDILIAKSLRDVRQTTQYFDGIGRPYSECTKAGLTTDRKCAS